MTTTKKLLTAQNLVIITAFLDISLSVPYQLYEWLKVFQAEPECPEFTYHYGFLIGISKDSDEYDKYKITFNLSAYDSWREVAASFLKLAFTLTMAIGTYKKFKGEL